MRTERCDQCKDHHEETWLCKKCGQWFCYLCGSSDKVDLCANCECEAEQESLWEAMQDEAIEGSVQATTSEVG